MFNKEFYPTPTEVLDSLGIDWANKVILEPSAGSGNIVDYAVQHGAKTVYVCEKDPKLSIIAASKGKFLTHDFFHLKDIDVTMINTIVMNPPFSNADAHILHAFNIAPEGCEIYALCNSNTLSNDYTSKRKELLSTIKDYGSSIELGDVFAESERTTDVQVSLVTLFKPITSQNFDYDGFFFDQEPDSPNDEGIVSHSELRAIVNTYVSAVKKFDEFESALKNINDITKYVGYSISINDTNNSSSSNFANHLSKIDFIKGLQVKCWNMVFSKLNMNRMVTSGVKKDIAKFIESQSNYPFTMKNVSKMLEIIVGTRSQTMDRAIKEAVDHFTKHTHENRYGVEGWKTNEGHMLGKKFIINYACVKKYDGGMEFESWRSGNSDKLIDLVKAICYLKGENYDNVPEIGEASATKDIDGNYIFKESYRKEVYHAENYNRFTPNVWYDWHFFEIKMFKKGTMHLKFKSESDWYLLNKNYARIMGQVLPEKL